MASDIKIKFDTESFNEIVRLNCENVSCRFNLLSQHTCSLKWVNIGKGGMCANFEEITKEAQEAFLKRLEGEQ